MTRVRAVLALVLVVVATTLVGGARADLDDVDELAHGHWDDGRGRIVRGSTTHSCLIPSGPASWGCQLEFFTRPGDCHETSKSNLAGLVYDNCAIYFEAMVTLVKTVNGAGRVTGCHTQNNNFGAVRYDSDFYNSDITDLVVRVEVSDDVVVFRTDRPYTDPVRHRTWDVRGQFYVPLCPKILLTGDQFPTGDMVVEGHL